LLGQGYTLAGNVAGSDGNLYSGDTTWHSDVQGPQGPGWGWQAKSTCRHLKIAFYIDEGLTKESGALRVSVVL
jgi:hypothetical protein